MENDKTMKECEYKLRIENFPYDCCRAQKYCPTVHCPANYLECPVYNVKIVKIKKQ